MHTGGERETCESTNGNPILKCNIENGKLLRREKTETWPGAVLRTLHTLLLSVFSVRLAFSYPFLPPRYAEIISNVDVETAANMREFITL